MQILQTGIINVRPRGADSGLVGDCEKFEKYKDGTMSKRYEIKYGELYEYDVISETECFVTVTNRYKFLGSKPQRMSKKGTYTTARECLQTELESARRNIAHMETKLDREKQMARKYAQILNDNPDEKLVEAFKGAFEKKKNMPSTQTAEERPTTD